MWTQIAKELQNLLNNKIISSQCENRWRVVERGYKKFIDNQTSTGRGKKYFEYQEELENILGRKKNIFPELLLKSNTINLPPLNEEVHLENGENHLNVAEAEVHKEYTSKPSTSATSAKNKRFRKRRVTLLESLNSDRKKYYEERIAVEKQKVEQMKIRNELIMERNAILKEKRCSCNT